MGVESRVRGREQGFMQALLEEEVLDLETPRRDSGRAFATVPVYWQGGAMRGETP